MDENKQLPLPLPQYDKPGCEETINLGGNVFLIAVDIDHGSYLVLHNAKVPAAYKWIRILESLIIHEPGWKHTEFWRINSLVNLRLNFGFPSKRSSSRSAHGDDVPNIFRDFFNKFNLD